MSCFLGKQGSKENGLILQFEFDLCASLCRDLAVIVASIAYNTWFTKLYCKDMRIVNNFLFSLYQDLHMLLLLSLMHDQITVFFSWLQLRWSDDPPGTG